MTLADIINEKFTNKEFSLKDVYNTIPDKPKETIRARIYDNLGIKFERIGRSMYKAIKGDNRCLILEGDGRKLDKIGDNTIDCIITDHAWDDKTTNKGGNRDFATYETFKYTLEDFKEKARVLKPGCFLVEMVPAENENNYEYLYQIKKMAEECGLKYYSKVPWRKGNFVSNTGRKAKNTEDILFFTKGKARPLRKDAKKTASDDIISYMSGTNGMLPTEFNVSPIPPKERINKSEKPIELWKQIIRFVTKCGEVVLDQCAGSCGVGIAALETFRNAIMIEIDKNQIELVLNRYGMVTQ